MACSSTTTAPLDPSANASQPLPASLKASENGYVTVSLHAWRAERVQAALAGPVPSGSTKPTNARAPGGSSAAAWA